MDAVQSTLGLAVLHPEYRNEISKGENFILSRQNQLMRHKPSPASPLVYERNWLYILNGIVDFLIIAMPGKGTMQLDEIHRR